MIKKLLVAVSALTIVAANGDVAVVKYYARAHLGPKGFDGSSSTASADAPPPLNPRKPDENDDDFAAYVRQTGAQVLYYAGKTPQSANSLESIGLTSTSFDYSPHGNYESFVHSNGKVFYYVNIGASDEGDAICQKIDSLSGNNAVVNRYNGLDVNRADEGCGGDSNSLKYWRRIDQAQQAAQMDVFIKNAQITYANVKSIGYVPNNISDIGETLNYYGLGAPRAGGFSYPPSDYLVYSEANINDQALCAALNVKGGGSANVGPYGNDGRDGRVFGCGGDSGSMTFWYDITSSFVPTQTALIENFVTSVNAVVASNGGGQSGQDASGASLGGWANYAPNGGKPLANVIGETPYFAKINGFYYVQMKISSLADCQAIANKYGIGRISRYNGKDTDRFPVGCGGDSNQLYYWQRAQ